MIVWGGQDIPSEFNTGGRYDPSEDSWTSTGAPDGRADHTAVWTGSEMIVWGGDDLFNGSLNTVGGTIQLSMVGRPLAQPTRPMPRTFTPQSGLAVK